VSPVQGSLLVDCRVHAHLISQDFSGIACETCASAVCFIALQKPAVRLHFILALKVSIFDPQDSPKQVENVLRDAYVTLNDALLGDLLVLDVDLQKDRVYKLALGRLSGPAHQVIEGVEQNAGDFALPQAIVLAHSCDLVQLDLYQLD